MRLFWIAGFVLCAVASSVAAQTRSLYDQGHSDRLDWEVWLGSLQGERREGAEYWASQRSLAHPGSCGGSNGSRPQEFIDGCHEAQDRLGPTDVRRHTDPQYRQGWNAPLVTTGTASANLADPDPAAQPTRLLQNPPAAAENPPAVQASAAPLYVAPMAVTDQTPPDEGFSRFWIVGAAVSFMFGIMAIIYIKNRDPIVASTEPAMHPVRIQVVKVRQSGGSGVLSGIIGCTFGVLGIFTFGLIFVPLAALFSFIGLLRGASGLSAFGILVSLVGAGLTVAGFCLSPTLWLVAAALIGLVASAHH